MSSMYHLDLYSTSLAFKEVELTCLHIEVQKHSEIGEPRSSSQADLNLSEETSLRSYSVLLINNIRYLFLWSRERTGSTILIFIKIEELEKLEVIKMTSLKIP